MTTDQQSKAPTILLTEDDPLLVNMYKAKFASEGMNLISAEDGEKGLKYALEGVVDLIVLDMMMPRLSGIDMLTQLRQSPAGKNIPVIILSNLTDEEDVRKAEELGVKEYLTKSSLTPGQLVDIVKKYL